MDPHLMLKRFREDEHFRAALLERARRERADTLHRLLLRPLLGLFKLPSRATRRAEVGPARPLGCG